MADGDPSAAPTRDASATATLTRGDEPQELAEYDPIIPSARKQASAGDHEPLNTPAAASAAESLVRRNGSASERKDPDESWDPKGEVWERVSASSSHGGGASLRRRPERRVPTRRGSPQTLHPVESQAEQRGSKCVQDEQRCVTGSRNRPFAHRKQPPPPDTSQASHQRSSRRHSCNEQSAPRRPRVQAHRPDVALQYPAPLHSWGHCILGTHVPVATSR